MRKLVALAFTVMALASPASGATAQGANANSLVTSALSDYTLSVSGQCPGLVTIEWEGARPHRSQGVILGSRLGAYSIPTGRCAGTILGIESNVWLMYVISTENGGGRRRAMAGSHPCAWYLQLIEGDSCRLSNPAQIP